MESRHAGHCRADRAETENDAPVWVEGKEWKRKRPRGGVKSKGAAGK